RAFLRHGDVRRAPGVIWTSIPSAHGAEIAILFPRLGRATMGKRLDAILRSIRRGPVRLVGCWALDASLSKDLGVSLMARGFDIGWRPHWMSLALATLHATYPRPGNLRVETIDDEAGWLASCSRRTPTSRSPISDSTARHSGG